MPDARPAIVFLVNVLQDVNVLRPLAFLAARETETDLRFLVSAAFAKRDREGTWAAELAALARAVAATVETYESPGDAFLLLQGGRGMLVAGSESDLANHVDVHAVFRAAPPGYVRVTLQHGLECVGFLQSREQIAAHGRRVGFAADVVCTWLPPDQLSAMAPAERAKVYVTGPQMLLQETRPGPDHPPVAGGLVCENLHSVRLRASGDHGTPFMETFAGFCDHLRRAKRQVTLRPHPGGQYVLRNKVRLPKNVVLNNLPMYRVDLGAYDYGISAPSTVVLDMLLARIPVAVWRDPADVMDGRIYEGLTAISGLDDWIAFARDAEVRREFILDRQRDYLGSLGMPLDPAEVYRRFARLFVNATSGRSTEPVRASARAPGRILFFASTNLPTLQIAFGKPLAPLVAAGETVFHHAFEQAMASELGASSTPETRSRWIEAQFDRADPDLVVACRYGGPGAKSIVRTCEDRGIPLIYHVDDDLLHVPREFGETKYRYHNAPARLESVRYLMDHADLVYCATAELRRRFRELGFRQPMAAGPLYCSAEVLKRPVERPVRVIGYMGFDHAHDFRVALPGLVAVLRRHPGIRFELFGRIPVPAELDAFGARVRTIPPVEKYGDFMTSFAALDWDIGIAPLADTVFNRCKANTKWAEYTSVGAAVVATRGMIYDRCGADGCARLVEDGWADTLEDLIADPAARCAQVLRAQARLEAEFGVDRLRRQVLAVFAEARSRAAASRQRKVRA